MGESLNKKLWNKLNDIKFIYNIFILYLYILKNLIF